jgi:hypothetical protein
VNFLNRVKSPSSIILLVVLIFSILLGLLSYRTVVGSPVQAATTPTPVPLPTRISSGPTVPLPPVEEPAKILGVEGDPQTNFTGIPWVRLAYPTCGREGKLSGNVLRETIGTYHKAGIHVLLTVCQGTNDNLSNPAQLSDAAQGLADAVQCGNEEMKLDPSVAFLYISPDNFARFYDVCASIMHALRPEIPVLLGSLDPHVGGIDVQPVQDQVSYLDQMQDAMNNTVHPGGHWDWHAQTLGLIDSWHNGYPDASVNSLAALFTFWAQQFHVNLNSGQLGKHLWVVEGTGCFKGCGIDVNNKAQVAIAHILSLITNVQTSLKYGVPFFHFSGKDFVDAGFYWPVGVLDFRGRAKPIRQDLPMGARTLVLSCASGKVTVSEQSQLLAKLYDHCILQSDYDNVVTS